MGKAHSTIRGNRRGVRRAGLASVGLAIALTAAAGPADSFAKKPDLRVTSISTSSTTSAPGSGLNAADTTKNNGKRQAPGSTTGYLLSKDERRDKTDLVLGGQRAVPKLKARGKSAGRAGLRVSPSTPAGRYRLLACADIAGRVKEENESNNCRASAGFVEIAAPAPTPISPVDQGPAPPQTTPPTPPDPFTGAAFRFTDLDLRDPHVVIECFGMALDITDGSCFGASFNGGLQKNLTSDEDHDGFLDLSPVNLFDPFDQEASTMPAQIDVGAECTAAQPTSCGPGAPVATTATNASTGTCLDVLTNTTTPSYTPEVATPAAPCFATEEGDLTLSLSGIPITLHGASLAATFVGDPATAETNGLIRGFITEADADATIIPASFPVVGNQPVSKLFPGGKNNPSSHDDRDTRNAVSGWWVYLNFTATRTTWVP